jgi:hypothetical protein
LATRCDLEVITPAIKHINKFCGMPVFPENGGHALIYLVAGLIAMNYNIEYEREEDGRWIAGTPELPGVMAQGTTAGEAMTKAETLALRVPAERLEMA